MPNLMLKRRIYSLIQRSVQYFLDLTVPRNEIYSGRLRFTNIVLLNKLDCGNPLKIIILLPKNLFLHEH
jgi:hypothetical protein